MQGDLQMPNGYWHHRGLFRGKKRRRHAAQATAAAAANFFCRKPFGSRCATWTSATAAFAPGSRALVGTGLPFVARWKTGGADRSVLHAVFAPSSLYWGRKGEERKKRPAGLPHRPLFTFRKGHTLLPVPNRSEWCRGRCRRGGPGPAAAP